MNKLQKLMDKILDWSSKTFENETSISKLNHLKKEVSELIDAIESKSEKENVEKEYADCFMLLIASAKLNGISAKQLIKITYEKLEINKLRKWGDPDKNGVVEHIHD